MESEYEEILHMIDLIVQEHAELAIRVGRLEIIHRLWVPGTVCKEGEEVFDIVALRGDRTQSLPFSTKQRALIDYLARYKVGQTASQITAGMNIHPFFVNHGKNAKGMGKFKCRINRTSLKVDIERLRKIGTAGFRDLNLIIDPFHFVESIKTEKEVRYRLRAFVKWKHLQY